jgi:hypothetical protein
VTSSIPSSVPIRALALSGTNLYAAGFDNDSGRVFRIDAPSGQTLGTFSYNPNQNLLDGFNTVATDGVNVYFGGARGIDLADMSFASGTAVLGILPANFVDATTPAIVSLTQADLIWSLTVSSSGLIVAGQKSVGTGFAARCTLDGVCPADLL